MLLTFFWRLIFNFQLFSGVFMKRALYSDLLKWKNNKNKKPLLLQGARQVGKTYLIKKFGEKEYENMVYLNFEEEPALSSLFETSLNANTILENISIYIGKKIEKENTLLFFDEVQEVPQVITSLKYFYEQMPDLHIIAAGSLLGVSIATHHSFPVGKVNFLTLYPMSFYEFLEAIGEKLLKEKIVNIDKLEPLPEAIHNKLLAYYKKYLFLGGMPESIKSYIESGDISVSREVQLEIIEAYRRDFSKYSDKRDAIKTSEVWESIPFQLARENKKFKFKDVKNGGRASKYNSSIEWLRKAGLIYIAYNIKTPRLPLKAYADFSKFKIYLLDTGLLGAMLNLPQEIIINPSAIFREFYGAFIENYVAAELTSTFKSELFYWTSKSDAEVDFILQAGNNIFPVEVKSGTNRNIKSLRSYYQKYNPLYIFRLSPRNLIRDNEFINIPLYLTGSLKQIFEILNS